MLIIKPSVIKEISSSVEPDLNECCGFLFGYQNIQNKTITKVIGAANSKVGDKRTNYEITSKDYLQAEHIAFQEDLDLLGIYHTHPNRPAIPSDYDQQMALPCFSYIIISVIDKKIASIRSWQLDDDLKFKEEKILYLFK
jgi:proteasome lid subunit RPN8/RPN11